MTIGKSLVGTGCAGFFVIFCNFVGRFTFYNQNVSISTGFGLRRGGLPGKGAGQRRPGYPHRAEHDVARRLCAVDTVFQSGHRGQALSGPALLSQSRRQAQSRRPSRRRGRRHKSSRPQSLSDRRLGGARCRPAEPRAQRRGRRRLRPCSRKQPLFAGAPLQQGHGTDRAEGISGGRLDFRATAALSSQLRRGIYRAGTPEPRSHRHRRCPERPRTRSRTESAECQRTPYPRRHSPEFH